MASEPNRRQFFQNGFRSIARPIAEFIAERITGADEPTRTQLRPPGAIAEAEFLDTCYRCGNCVESCPADAIRLLPSDDELLNNTPVVDPDLAPCVICDELACMKSCPSGALQLVSAPNQIRMGSAKVLHELCSRTAGEDCTKCIDVCPLGTEAIRLTGAGAVEVLTPGCVGCGVCQFHCPTQPKSITILPS